MTRAVSAAVVVESPPSSKNSRIKNFTSQNAGESTVNNCQKRKISRLPSKEDPGPSRTHELIFNFEDANIGANNGTNNGLLASQNHLSSSILNAGDFLASAAGVHQQQQQQEKSAINFWFNPCSAATATAGVFSTTKFKFVNEGQIQICRLNHARTVLGKLSSSKLLRRWETHFLILGDDEIKSKTGPPALKFWELVTPTPRTAPDPHTSGVRYMHVYHNMYVRAAKMIQLAGTTRHCVDSAAQRYFP
uniref:C-Maf-inducing protein PH domain-containing protein n=1 Tax=Romanomermis culicivorax TaxID=13658 RepID=A0A915I2Y2_ROMCU